jgi:PEGA domain-containing protein
MTVTARIAAVLVLALLPLAARAAETPPEADLIRRGVAEREQGRDQAALELFREAFERYRTPRAQAQMGLAYQALGRWGDADFHVSGALAQASDPWISSNRKVLEQALQVIAGHVGTVEVMSNVPGTEILVDGHLVGQLPLRRPLRLSGGTAMIQARAEGHVPSQRPVNIVPGQLTRESFTLLPLSKAPEPAPVSAPAPAYVEATAPPPAAPAPSFLQSRWTLVGAAAATAVVGGVALWSGLDTLSARDRYVADPTEEGYRNGVSREKRTNWLIGSTATLGAATLALGLFATRW